MRRVAPARVVPQSESVQAEADPTSCPQLLRGAHLPAGGVTWHDVAVEAETLETQEAGRAALLDLGIRVARSPAAAHSPVNAPMRTVAVLETQRGG
jgi:hypothetical protein